MTRGISFKMYTIIDFILTSIKNIIKLNLKINKDFEEEHHVIFKYGN